MMCITMNCRWSISPWAILDGNAASLLKSKKFLNNSLNLPLHIQVYYCMGLINNKKNPQIHVNCHDIKVTLGHISLVFNAFLWRIIFFPILINYNNNFNKHIMCQLS